MKVGSKSQALQLRVFFGEEEKSEMKVLCVWFCFRIHMADSMTLPLLSIHTPSFPKLTYPIPITQGPFISVQKILNLLFTLKTRFFHM